ncbi:MAG: nucleoside triphosphate hydrolase [Rhodobacteraceae bacterium]|nr:nucleoside triphosphate hydrolase [Paracoccaceae bacterium]
MRSSKSRSRSKSSRNRPSGGNVVNRVFDSSGPEGKVRGTPQQIIDKYNQLARDAQLGNDRVAAENFQQHAEHYLRLLSEAQREQDQRREEQERQNRERQAERDRERAERQERESNTRSSDPAEAPQPDVIDVIADEAAESDSGLVETPESAPKKTTRSSSSKSGSTRSTTPRKKAAPKKPKAEAKAGAKAEAKDADAAPSDPASEPADGSSDEGKTPPNQAAAG